MKLVINKCYGGFSISRECAEYMAERGHALAKGDIEYASKHDLWSGHGYGANGMSDGYDRSDPLLVEAVEALGDEASGNVAALDIVEIPDGVDWEVQEYDGQEWVAEKHRTWR